MKIFGKLVGIACAASLVMCTAGCGNTVEKVKVDEGERMTITWLGVPWYSDGEEGGYVEKLIEDKYNINIEPVIMDNKEYSQKKSMLLSGGEIPDVIYELDPKYLQADAKEGFLAEIPYETIREYAPTAFAALNEAEPRAWLYSMYDKKNYGVPNFDHAGSVAKASLWRVDWLKKVGINKVPETLEEMHDAFVKFKSEDPDGNEKNDTYGMTGDVKTWNNCFTEIFGAYGVLPFDWMEKDGEIVYGGFEQGTKDAIEMLAQWYQEGLIHPDFIIDEGSDKKFINGEVGYHGTTNSKSLDESRTNSTITKMKALNPNVELSYAQVTGSNGEAGRFSWGKAAHVIAFGYQMEKQPEKLKIILQIIEDLATDDAFASTVRMGEEGVTWERIPESEGGGARFLGDYTDSNQVTKALLGSTINSFSFFGMFPTDKAHYEANLTAREKELNETYLNSKYSKSDYFLKPDVVNSASKYLSKLQDKQMTVIAEIIRGEKNIDAYSEFEEYWKANGGPTLEKEAQELQGTLQGLYKELGIQQ